MIEELGCWNYFLNYCIFSLENILLGLFVGSYVVVVDWMSDVEMMVDCMVVFCDVFGGGFFDLVEVFVIYWLQDLLMFGVYFYIVVGNWLVMFDVLVKLVVGIVMLVGEYIIFVYYGIIYGVYFSGLWVVEYFDEELVEQRCQKL